MSIYLKPSHIEAYIRDPVLASWAIFNIEWDVAQAVRLRLMWGVPETIDDSGIYMGKTDLLWVWAQLRCILLAHPVGFDPRGVLILYPTLASAEKNFGEKYTRYIETCPIFRRELARQHGGKLGYKALTNGFSYVYKNKSFVYCPAPGWENDAAGLASLRVHDGGVDEAKEVDLKSDGLDKQVLGRVNARCYNQDHPVWTNHVVLMGHAEDPVTHPFYKRVKTFRRLIRDGSQDHAVITSCYMDWTPKFGFLRKDKEIRRDKIAMSKARFGQIRLGLWAHGTEDWYDSKVMRKVLSPRAPVLTRSDSERAIFTLGWDTAPGANRNSDLNAGVATRAIELPWSTRETAGVFRANGRAWRISPCWAVEKRGGSVGELCGIIHRAHQRFQFSRVVYDPQGGGSWLTKDLWKAVQFFDGEFRAVTGICSVENSPDYPEAVPLLVPYARRALELHPVWQQERYLSSDEGIVEATHRTVQALFEAHECLWPQLEVDLPDTVKSGWDPETRRAALALQVAFLQFHTIKVLVDEASNAPRLTKRGFLVFKALGKKKKDLAYAALYSLVGMLSLLMDPDFDPQEGQEGAGDCVAVG